MQTDPPHTEERDQRKDPYTHEIHLNCLNAQQSSMAVLCWRLAVGMAGVALIQEP